MRILLLYIALLISLTSNIKSCMHIDEPELEEKEYCAPGELTYKVHGHNEKTVNISQKFFDASPKLQVALKQLPADDSYIDIPDADINTLIRLDKYINEILEVNDYFYMQMNHDKICQYFTDYLNIDCPINLSTVKDKMYALFHSLNKEEQLDCIRHISNTRHIPVKLRMFKEDYRNTFIIEYLARYHLTFLIEKSYLKYIPTKKLEGFAGSINSIAISPCLQYIVSGSDNRKVRIWNMQDDKLLKELEGHSDKINSVAISQCGKYIVSGSSDKTIIIWNLQTGELVLKLEGHKGSVLSVAISANNKYIISGSDDKCCIIWNLETNRANGIQYNHPINSVTISSDEQTAAFSCCGKIIVWDIPHNQEITTLFHSTIKSYSMHDDGVGAYRQQRIETEISSIAMATDDSHIISISKFNRLILFWDINHNEPIKSLGHYGMRARSVAIPETSDAIISGNIYGQTEIWNIKNGRSIMTLNAHTGSVNSVLISKNNEFIISGSDDKTIMICEAQTSKDLEENALKILKALYRSQMPWKEWFSTIWSY